MLYQSIKFIVDTVSGLFAGVLLLRVWMQWVGVRPYQPLMPFILQITNWLVHPIACFFPKKMRLNWPCLLAAYAVAFLCTWIKIWVLFHYFFGLIFLLAVLTLLEWAIWGWITLLCIEVLLSWTHPHAPVAPFIRALNAPLLHPIRRMVPLLSGIDLSPLILFLILQFITRLLQGFSMQLAGVFV